MNYTLNQLKIFLQITESKSITKAAEALFLTQPAVSIQLKKLQDQFPIPLTEVIGRQLYVTEFGKEVAKSAKRVLREIEAIDHQGLAFKNLLTGRLKISVASTGKYVMPYFLTDFVNAHRGVDLVMDVTNKTLVVESLRQNEVDFALVSVVPEDLNTEQLPLLQNKLYLVGSTKFTNVKPKRTRAIFREYPLLLREQGSATRQAMERFITTHDLPVFKQIELTSNEAVKQAVIAGLGYSIMPLIGLKDALKNKEIEIIPFKDLPIVTSWNLIWLKAKKHSPAAQRFLEYLTQEKERIINDHFGWYEEY